MQKFVLIAIAALTVWGSAAAHAAPAGNGSCLSCHGESSMAKTERGNHLFIDPLQFASTSHAQIGCPSCHNGVSAAHPKDGIRPPRANCQECHGAVMQEYAQTRHAQKAGCADCHDPHRAKTIAYASGAEMNRQCAQCHDKGKMLALHGRWLPQSDLHMDAVPCITCHVGSKDYVINLYVVKEAAKGELKTASYQELAALEPGRDIKGMVDKNGDGNISLEELRSFNKYTKTKGLILTGMMVPKTMSHTFQTMDNRWDCTYCHAAGPKTNQESFLALPDANGQYPRFQVQRGAVLDLLYGTPDFYMLGSTRSFPLSVLGGLIILGGLAMPLGHGSLRFLTRKNRKEH
ncbi:cytochrome C [Geomonas sp. RF6]|uniref:cytochrome c3 family protein n=1 Tax=Geomonas sp. RF6 TaxID=2897342 RepID=UPI001E4DE442|nr:cytochrome c3 family protein [Geomonas sp. RF6]UFS71531.1 cytochrome C [Geomonas sp. RF6]